MLCSLGERGLRDLVLYQLASQWPPDEADAAVVEAALPAVLGRLERCFSRIRNKYYSDEAGETLFDHLHGCQWAHFLYALAREIWLGGVCLAAYLRQALRPQPDAVRCRPVLPGGAA